MTGFFFSRKGAKTQRCKCHNIKIRKVQRLFYLKEFEKWAVLTYINTKSGDISRLIRHIREIVEERKRLDIRFVLEVLKSAEKQKEIKNNQTTIDFYE